MSPLITRASVALVLSTLAGCSSARMHAAASPSSGQELTERERVAHVLSRLAFGPRPGDAERVAAMGVDRWIGQQLNPETIPDSAVALALAPISVWKEPVASVASLTEAPLSIVRTPIATLRGDSAARATLAALALKLRALTGLNDYFAAGKVIRAQLSERQLAEVLSDFWENHFSVFTGKMPSSDALILWDREAIRPHAMGKFRDLLGAVAHSPAMLYYLDNQLSTSQGLNENYARELLELHTLGVDGGYTQHDVVEVARALTGWTIKRTAGQVMFEFRRATHDTGMKVVLGHQLAAGRGIEDGEQVLDILARHPSTARHIAYKLARRLVSDEPPPLLVTRAADTFMRTDGDITEVVRTIVTSREFFSRMAFRAKVKTPFELVVSVRRALDAPADTTPFTARLLTQFGQATFGWASPDGWPERGDAWINSGTMYKRIKFAGDVVYGTAGIGQLERWHDWSTLVATSLDRQIDGVVASLLGGVAQAATREAMLAANTEGVDGAPRLRALLSIALASPEFQRR